MSETTMVAKPPQVESFVVICADFCALDGDRSKRALLHRVYGPFRTRDQAADWGFEYFEYSSQWTVSKVEYARPIEPLPPLEEVEI